MTANKTAKKPVTRPRIITLTIRRLRELADRLLLDPEHDGDAAALLAWADELDAGADGRETQEKRKRRKAVAATRKAGKR